MLEVQKLFNEINDINLFKEYIINELGCIIKDYPDHELMVLNYSQIDGIKNHPITNECRALMLSYDGKIVRKSFNRFFNLYENDVDTFDFDHSIAYEKCDGSLCLCYFCDATNQWELGTRGTAFGEGINKITFDTYRKFFLDCIGVSEEQFQLDCVYLNKNYTYVFEGVGPDNKIVTAYTYNHLVCLTIIDNMTCEECFENIPEELNWNYRYVAVYSFASQADCLSFVAELANLEEGFVVRNYNTNERIKIKSPVYVAAHHLRGNGLNLNSICELVAMEETAEYIAVFPEDSHKFDKALYVFELIKTEIEAKFEQYNSIVSQKDFALSIKDFEYSSVLFKARNNKLHPAQVFNSFPTSKKAEWIKTRLLSDEKD